MRPLCTLANALLLSSRSVALSAVALNAVALSSLACSPTAAAPKSVVPLTTAESPSTEPSNMPGTPPKVPEVAPTPVPAKPPIAIANGRLHGGYIVGGLPTRENFDAAAEAGIDSALSLMANDEDGIREVAPYASSIGIRYIRFTVRNPQDLTESMAWQFASSLGMVGSPAIIHSGGGERVGAMFALVAFFVDENSADDAIAIGMQAGMGSLATHVRSVMIR